MICGKMFDHGCDDFQVNWISRQHNKLFNKIGNSSSIANFKFNMSNFGFNMSNVINNKLKIPKQ